MAGWKCLPVFLHSSIYIIKSIPIKLVRGYIVNSPYFKSNPSMYIRQTHPLVCARLYVDPRVPYLMKDHL
jgi:hypothetical protein